jgi:hypothetical protein
VVAVGAAGAVVAVGAAGAAGAVVAVGAAGAELSTGVAGEGAQPKSTEIDMAIAIAILKSLNREAFVVIFSSETCSMSRLGADRYLLEKNMFNLFCLSFMLITSIVNNGQSQLIECGCQARVRVEKVDPADARKYDSIPLEKCQNSVPRK